MWRCSRRQPSEGFSERLSAERPVEESLRALSAQSRAWGGRRDEAGLLGQSVCAGSPVLNAAIRRKHCPQDCPCQLQNPAVRSQQPPSRSIEEVIERREFTRKNEDGRDADRHSANRRLRPLANTPISNCSSCAVSPDGRPVKLASHISALACEHIPRHRLQNVSTTGGGS